MNIQLSNIQASQILMEHEVFGTGGGSYAACVALVNYLEQLEDDIGEEISLDPIALRCEYNIGTFEDFRDWYGLERDVDVQDWLNDHTTVIDCENGFFIIQEF